MFKLTKANFKGLQGIEDLNLDFSEITTLTGPNGTGKSTVLGVLDLALRIVGEKEICALLPDYEPWYLFDSAELTFVSDELIKMKFLGEAQEIVVRIEIQDLSYHIESVSSNKRTYNINKPVLKSELDEWDKGVAEALASLSEMERILSAAAEFRREEVKQQLTSSRVNAIENLNFCRKKLEDSQTILVDLIEDGAQTGATYSRADFNEFLKDLDLPSVRLITTGHLMEQDIPALIDRLVSLKIGNTLQERIFKDREKRLNELLRSQTHFYINNTKNTLLINGVPYDKASTGTYLTLAFFAITNSEDPNKIILWDEPENGLHPTRRTQLLELMGRDPRQFVLATHATEFAPVLQSDCKVYRCVSDYDEENSHFQFSVVEVACRREAFKTLEALGISPARTLFTANVVIWVEGPTDLLFYRHWLAKRLEPKGYQEGLHYTFMQYGGSLINYLEVADNMEVESTIDLLSHCRHPIILVDSDLEEVPVGKRVEDLLKTGAKRISQEITKLNDGRSDAAMFLATRGREIENYLPAEAIFYAVEKLWADFSNLKKSLDLSQFQLDPFEKYFDSLGKFFIANKVVDKDNKPKGRSIWGADNKVAMMAAALAMPDFDDNKLLLNCRSDLQKIEDFICQKHAVGYSTTLKN